MDVEYHCCKCDCTIESDGPDEVYGFYDGDGNLYCDECWEKLDDD